MSNHGERQSPSFERRRKVGFVVCAIALAIVGFVPIPIGPNLRYSVAALAVLAVYALHGALQPSDKVQSQLEKTVSGVLLAILVLILAALVWRYLKLVRQLA